MILFRRFLRLVLITAFAALAGLPAAAESYRVSPGDSLTLSIFAQPELSGEHRVREDGVVALHLIGEVPVAGLTLTEVSEAVAKAAERVFGARASVIADIAAYPDIYVIGDVTRPGAHPYAPGLTVIKALALAGDVRRAPILEEDAGRRILDERRRLLLASSRVDEAQASIAVIDAELARLDAGGAAALVSAPKTDLPDPGDRLAQQTALIDARREVAARAVDGAARQQKLAVDEAELFNQRNALVARQLEITEQNLRDVDDLVARGLVRRDRQLDLSLSADDFRSDSLEIAAFEARARQVAANAENTAAVSVSRYRESLIADRIAAARGLDAAMIEVATSREFLEANGDVAGAVGSLGRPVLRYEIVRDGVTTPAEEGTALRPGDVLRATLEAASDE
jgi:protein involved in polysaccharide export with SLBB domain